MDTPRSMTFRIGGSSVQMAEGIRGIIYPTRKLGPGLSPHWINIGLGFRQYASFLYLAFHLALTLLRVFHLSHKPKMQCQRRVMVSHFISISKLLMGIGLVNTAGHCFFYPAFSSGRMYLEWTLQRHREWE